MTQEYSKLGRDTLNRWALNARQFNYSGFVAINDVRVLATSSLVSDLRGTVTLVPNEVMVPVKITLKGTIGRTSSKIVNYEQFYELVAPSVQGCPQSMVIMAIKNSCIEFCEKSHIWKQEGIVNDVIANQPRYGFVPPRDAKVVTPYRIAINGRELVPTDLKVLEETQPGWRNIISSVPHTYFLDTDDTVRLIGSPTELIPDALEAGVVLKPTRESRGCPSFLYQDWAETIAAGALSKLMAMKGKIWAQEALVGFYDRQFRAGISRARSKSNKSWQQSSKDMLPKHFYS